VVLIVPDFNVPTWCETIRFSAAFSARSEDASSRVRLPIPLALKLSPRCATKLCSSRLVFQAKPHLNSDSSLSLTTLSTKMSTQGQTQANIESPALALRHIGMSSRDLMAAINRMGSGRETVSSSSNRWMEQFTKSPPDQETSSRLNFLDTFSSFGELPSELRIKIWSYVCFHPRNVDIMTEKLGTVRISDSTYADVHKFFSHACSHPAVLQVCRESREEGLKHYQLEFGTSYNSSIINVSTPPQIYVNFTCDRICLLKPECFESEFAGQFQRFVEVCRKNGIRSLAVNVFEDQHV
jgi:hypothetical protein